MDKLNTYPIELVTTIGNAQKKEEDPELLLNEMEYCKRLCSLAMILVSEPVFTRMQFLKSKLLAADKHGANKINLSAEECNLISTASMIQALLLQRKFVELFRLLGLNPDEESLNTALSEAASISEWSKSIGIDIRAFSKKLHARRSNMSHKRYISDCHFFHNRLNQQMDRRGFASLKEMNQYMVRQWNSSVSERDEVYILGDFSIARGSSTNEILHELNGKKYLVIGNHDSFIGDRRFDMSLLEWVRPYAEINDGGRRVVLSHYPVFCYNGQYRLTKDGKPVTYMLYGHVHNTHDELLVNDFIQKTRRTFTHSMHGDIYIPCNMINCFCMFSNYIPLTLNEWIQMDALRRDGIMSSDMSDP